MKLDDYSEKQILITGGSGFVGSNIAIFLKTHHPNTHIIVADNLKRKGSELNLPRLRHHGIKFLHADIRNPEDMEFKELEPELIIDCSAEPSVLSGYGESPYYIINTNLMGTINCLELARRFKSDLIFLSTNRIYPFNTLNSISTLETDSRYVMAPDQNMPGVSMKGISERFPLEGVRSLYGATKLSSEMIIQEYSDMYQFRFIINRCSVIAGPWQMGRVDQGVFTLWMARHYFQGELSYIGWGGQGKQVRDLLHVNDLAELLDFQIRNFENLNGRIFNVGGGLKNSLSLLEATQLCQEITGHKITILSQPDNRPADLKWYVTDNTHTTQATGWKPRHTPQETLTAIFDWIRAQEKLVAHIWL